MGTEPTDASGTLVFDQLTGRWDESLLGELGLPVSQWPEITGSTSLMGEISSAAAEATACPLGHRLPAAPRTWRRRRATGRVVTGDFAALAAGRPTTLRLEARVTIDDEGSVLVIGNFPPNANPDRTAQHIANRAAPPDYDSEYPAPYRHTRLPLRDIRDVSLRRPAPHRPDRLRAAPRDQSGGAA